jgi:hypothetical protein
MPQKQAHPDNRDPFSAGYVTAIDNIPIRLTRVRAEECLE